jgi:hypothetical protein
MSLVGRGAVILRKFRIRGLAGERRWPASPAPGNRQRFLLVAAAVAVLAAIAIPLAPVSETVSTTRWVAAQQPAGEWLLGTDYQPRQLTATVTRDTVAAAALTGHDVVLLSTAPIGGGAGPETRRGLWQRHALLFGVRGSQLCVGVAGQEAFTIPADGPWSTLAVHSDARATSLLVDGATRLTLAGDRRPWVAGLFTQAGGLPLDGLGAEVELDNRFESSPTGAKLALIIVLIAAVVVLALASARPRSGPAQHSRRLRPTPLDGVVTAVLALWAVIGAGTVDDGYIRGIISSRANSGFVGNYEHWFNTPEAPFGLSYELHAAMIQLSTATVWLRLPALLLGLVSWLVIDRAVLPAVLGTRPRPLVRATAAGTLLLWHMAFNNGLRPEPWVALGLIVAVWGVERAIATGLLAPLVTATLAAMIAVSAAPSGLMALAPLLVGAPALRRAAAAGGRRAGVTWLTAVIGTASVCTALFCYDQTLGSVLDSSAIRATLWPVLSWYKEPVRWADLTGAAGSLSARAAVFGLLLACVIVGYLAVGDRGVGAGARRRVLAVVAVCFGVLALTPTKWVLHFGSLSSITPVLVAMAVAGLANSRRAAASTVAVLGAFGVAAFACASKNAFWFVENWGLPGARSAPTGLANALALIGLGLVVTMFLAPRRWGWWPPRRPELPLAMLSWLIVLALLITFGVSAQTRRNTFSAARQGMSQLHGESCGLADWVEVELDPGRGVLTAETPPTATGFTQAGGVPPGLDPPEEMSDFWGSGQGSGPNTAELVSGWYPLPPGPRSVPLVIPVAGRLGEGNELEVRAGRRLADGRWAETAHVALTSFIPDEERDEDEEDEDKDKYNYSPRWRDIRITEDQLDLTHADGIRVIARDRSLGSDSWLAIARPRLPALTPLLAATPPGQTMVSWGIENYLPCYPPVPLAHGAVAAIPRFAVGPDPALPYDAVGGGALAGLAAGSRLVERPSYLRNDWHRDYWHRDLGHVWLIEPDQQLPVARLDTTQRLRWGWSRDGVPSAAADLPRPQQ